jgi:glycosyltransferase involved in cell wall biosynthesis
MTIYNAVDVKDHAIKIDVQEKKRQLNISPDEKVIGIVARLVPVKNHRTLFAAFKKVRQACPKTRLLIVGEGPLDEDLRRFAAELGETENILFLGKRDDVRELLHIMDVVCLASLSEGLSLTLLEAMASARPAVATNVGGNPELVLDGLTGLLVPPRDPERMAEAIVALLRDDGRRRSMGEAGRRRVEEKFNIQNCVKEYEELYFTLARQKGVIR